MKKWEILNQKSKIRSSTFAKASAGKQKLDTDELVRILLENRNIKTKKEINAFLNPSLESLTPKNLGINKKDLEKTIKRIKKAIENNEKIIIFGDYDVDGITGTAILWESLNELGAKVMPYIPHRIEEGYGLSKVGIDNVLKEFPETKIIITVDNGIVAIPAVDYANILGLEVIITDHHVPGKNLPNAYAIVHSVLICGAGVAYILAREISNKTSKIQNTHLELVALATVADVMKLTGFNRTLLKFGLESLRKTKRPGLISLFETAKIEKEKIGVYEIGHIIAPRINAMGRLEHGLDSLRLLCTTDVKRAEELAQKLNTTNLERQRITFDSVTHARSLIGEKNMKKLLFLSHEIYEPGVIGLIAGRLTEEYYRPSIVISVGKTYSKASARSVSGFNIIEFIRMSSDLLVDAGGHPMAAGFTVETKKIPELKKLLETLSEKNITPEMLSRTLRIDCELPIEEISDKLFESINELSPFGPGNPEPAFLAKGVIIDDMRIVGKDQKHLKIQLSSQTRSDLGLRLEQGRTLKIGGILFNYDQSLNLKIADVIDVAYSISQNVWNGNKKLELKIKDIK